MITFSPLKLFLTTKKKKKSFPQDYSVPSPTEIRASIKNMTSCPKCKFLIFDNYWSHDIENGSERLCPTCGCKL